MIITSVPRIGPIYLGRTGKHLRWGTYMRLLGCDTIGSLPCLRWACCGWVHTACPRMERCSVYLIRERILRVHHLIDWAASNWSYGLWVSMHSLCRLNLTWNVSRLWRGRLAGLSSRGIIMDILTSRRCCLRCNRPNSEVTSIDVVKKQSRRNLLLSARYLAASPVAMECL